jgi:hypothetical protein
MPRCKLFRNDRTHYTYAANPNLDRFSCLWPLGSYAEFELVKGKLILYTCKPLAPGDEITCEYGSDYFGLFIAAIGCRCATCAAKWLKVGA